MSGASRMLMTIPLLMLASKIDFTEPSSVLILRAGYFGVVLLQVAVFWYIKQLVAAKNDQTKIWVTNEAPMQPKTVVETTYVALETERAQQGVQQAFTGALIMSLLHFQMGINQPLVLQIVMQPVQVFGSPLFKKYILGDTGKVWEESLTRPAGAPATTEARGGNATGGAAASSAATPVARFAELLQLAWAQEDAEAPLAPVLAMLEKGEVDVDDQVPEDAGHWTTLMVASAHKRAAPAVVDKLMQEYGADPFVQDADGWTALHWACYHNRPEHATRLVLGTLKGDTALTESTRRVAKGSGVFDLSARVQQLVAVEDASKRTAVQLAAEEKSTGVLRALKALGVPVPEVEADDGADAGVESVAADPSEADGATEATGSRKRAAAGGAGAGASSIEEVD